MISVQKSSYSLDSNITVAQNKTLSFTNTDITVVADFPLWIDVHGKLLIQNSSVSGLSKNSQINIVVSGNDTYGPGALELLNSSVDIPGMILGNRSLVTIYNSSIRAPTSSGEPVPVFRMNFYNSSVLVQNSTIDGLYRTGNTTDHTAGFMNYTGTSPVTNPGYIPLSFSGLISEKAIADAISIGLVYSGNNPGNNNSLEFYAGTDLLEKYTLNNTGSVYTKQAVSFEFNTTLWGYNLSYLRQNMEVYFNDSYAVGSNSTVWKLNMTLLSSDLVHIYGISRFNYILSNSSLVAGNSLIGINREAVNVSPNQPNPEKNSIVLMNRSSIYFVTDAISNDSGTSSPFVVISGSAAYAFEEINVDPSTHGIPLKNYSLSVIPYNMNSTVNYYSNASVNGLRQNLSTFHTRYTQYLLSFLDGEMAVPQNIIFSGLHIDSLNYKIMVDGRTFKYSPGPVVNYTRNSSLVPLSVNVPDIVASIEATTVFGNSDNSINISIESKFSGSGPVYWKIFSQIENRTEFGAGQISGIAAGAYDNLSVTLKTGSLGNLSSGLISLDLYSPEYTVTGKYVNVSKAVNAYSSLFLKINSSYRWLDNGLFRLNLSLADNGNSTFNGSVVNVLFFVSHRLKYNASFPIELGPGETVLYSRIYSQAPLNTDRIMVTVKPAEPYVIEPGVSLNYSMKVDPDREYSVSFSESGLPAGTHWGIEFFGKSLSSSGNSLSTLLVNGSYNVSVDHVPGYVAHPHFTVLVISGQNRIITVSFSPYLYSVQINETGLTNGTEWAVSVLSDRHNFTSDHGVIRLSNGSYHLYLNAPGYSYNTVLNVTVDGHNMYLSVSFQEINHSLLASAFQFIVSSRYALVAIALAGILYSYFRFRDSVKICGKCFTSYSGFGRCPVCRNREKENALKDEK